MINVSRIILFILWFTPLSTIAVTLEDLEWQSRPLLVFAADHHDKEWQAIRKDMNNYQCEIEDRNIVLGNFFLNGESTLSGQQVTEGYASELRQRFGVEANEFTVILIGKDGLEKYRSNKIPIVTELLGLIDRMPMRRIELRQQPSSCD